uniref:Uncharacterized protein n=1 Tax=Hyaloperonospora arabidopsidis (strain Emoy2) TaxID=559515 RepID=M4B1U6_HYAAE
MSRAGLLRGRCICKKEVEKARSPENDEAEGTTIRRPDLPWLAARLATLDASMVVQRARRAVEKVIRTTHHDTRRCCGDRAVSNSLWGQAQFHSYGSIA